MERLMDNALVKKTDGESVDESLISSTDSLEKIRNSLRMRVARVGIGQAQKVASLLIDAFFEHSCKLTEREALSRDIKFSTASKKSADFKLWRLELEAHGFIRNHIVTNQEGRMVRQWISAGKKLDEFLKRYNSIKSSPVSQEQIESFKKEVWENDVQVREEISLSMRKIEEFDERLSEVEKVIEVLIEIFDPPGHPSKTQNWLSNPAMIRKYVNVETMRAMLLRGNDRERAQ